MASLITVSIMSASILNILCQYASLGNLLSTVASALSACLSNVSLTFWNLNSSFSSVVSGSCGCFTNCCLLTSSFQNIFLSNASLLTCKFSNVSLNSVSELTASLICNIASFPIFVQEMYVQEVYYEPGFPFKKYRNFQEIFWK